MPGCYTIIEQILGWHNCKFLLYKT